MNSLILVRHGQSLWNKERRFTGWVDIDLTEQGKSEAEQAGQLIKELNIEFHAYFTSQLKRAINSLEIILKILDKQHAEIIKDSALNERHYGGLTSLNKDETIKKYGNKQVQIWRRSFDIPPPIMDSHHPYKNKINSNILSESLKDTLERVIPYYDKKIFNISNEKIIDFEIPTGNPLLIRFGESLEIAESKYLDKKRTKKIFFNV